jgi:DNA polymerase V
MSSRSFGSLVYERAELEEAVASYIAKAAEKLRAQASLAGAVQVYIQTSVFKPEMPQYQKGLTVPLPEATSDTRVLTQWAIRILHRIYRPGFGYHKAGVMLLDLVPITHRQFALFDSQGGAGDVQSAKLMSALDGINQRYGRGVVRLAVEGVDHSWQMRRRNLSPGYTTSWEGLPVVRAR